MTAIRRTMLLLQIGCKYMIEYSPACKAAFVTQVRTKIEAAAPLPGKVLIYSATQPTAGTAITDQILCAIIPFQVPCGEIVGNALQLFTPIEESLVPATSIIAWGRVVDGNDVWVADLNVGLAGSGASLIVNSVLVRQGGILRINSGIFTA